MPNQEPLVKPVPGKGAMLSKLASLVGNEGEFSESAEELDARGVDAPLEAPEAPESTQSAVEVPEAPAEVAAPVEAPEAPAPPQTPIPPTAVNEDWSDLEIVDEDTGERFQVRAKKEYADKVRNGYARKSAMSRATHYLAKYKNTLEPLITSGRFDDVAALISRVEQDKTFRDAVYDLTYRYALGRPIQFADQVAPVAQSVLPAQTPVQAEVSEEDPLGLKSLVTSAVGPLNQELAALRAAQDAQVQAQNQYLATQRAYAQAEQQTKAEFTTRFPGEYTGDIAADMPKYQQVLRYAQNAGLFERYGAVNNPSLYPLVMVTAKLEMDRDNYINAPSSAAMSAAQAAERAESQAREAAAALAASQGGGNAAAPAPVPVQRQKPSLVDDKGKKKNLKQIAEFYKVNPAVGV